MQAIYTLRGEGLNAPTGAWCSLTITIVVCVATCALSQCTYRCVVLPDAASAVANVGTVLSQCTYRCVVLPDATTMRS